LEFKELEKLIIGEGIYIKKGLIAPIFLLLCACQADEDDLFFVGESEHWTSKVTVYQSNVDETYQIEVSYKESHLQDFNDFNYYVENNNNKAIEFEESNASLNKQGIYQKNLPISNSPTIERKDEFIITVEWNGNSEYITLTNK
jgi:hypothetical protein